MEKEADTKKYFGIFTRSSPGNVQKQFRPASSLVTRNDQGKVDGADESLAKKLRPDDLEGFVGQDALINSKSILRRLIENNEIVSMIFWGPPGSGKSTLAHLIGKMLTDVRIPMIKLSATSSGIGKVSEAVRTALKERESGFRTLIFMDDIHRFNKLQQDVFLPHIEAGTFVLIGSTTENPSFCLNLPLLSRCRLFEFQRLDKSSIKSILMKGLALGNPIEPAAVDWICESSNGDARLAVNTLELLMKDHQSVEKCFEKAQTLSNRKYDEKMELVCALHHSIVADKPTAALYWLARLMATSEDPVFIGKRLIEIAAREIDFQSSDALEVAEHTISACQMIGMPECDIILGQCTLYLCKAPKKASV